jgi:hypothetical protein
MQDHGNDFPRTGTWWGDETLARREKAGDVVVGDRCLYRPGELVLSDRAVRLLQGDPEDPENTPDVLSRRARQDAERHPWIAEFGLTLWLVTDSAEAGDRLVEVALDLQRTALTRAAAGRPTTDDDLPIVVSLNHVLLGSPIRWGGPAGPPASTGATRDEAPYAVGADVDIAVLDTGVPNPSRLATWHPELEQSVRRTADNPQFPDDEDTLYDGKGTTLRHQAGHGTFIAGLVHLVAPELVISPYAVLDPDGMGDDLHIAAGILAVTSAPTNVPVVNLSLGGYSFDDNPPPVLQAVIAALPRTKVVVAAAGNQGSPRPFWPAALRDVVSVAAIDAPADIPAPTAWSDWGTWVDVCTLGEALLSDYVVGSYPTSSSTSVDFDAPTPMARWSGTSFAAPLVAAEIARRVKDDLTSGILPTGPVTADAAARDLRSELERLPSTRPVGLVYWPPVDPRRPWAT